MVTLKDIFADIAEEYEYYNTLTLVNLRTEDRLRLDRLCKRVGKNPDDVVCAALLLYEDGLNAVDEGMRRGSYMSMSFELRE